MNAAQERYRSALEYELERRELARNDFLAFIEYVDEDWVSSEHHRRIADALEALERGDIDRLMVFAPPRHSKSQMGSRAYPAWFLGRNPKAEIICTTYSSEFSADFGRDVRDIVTSTQYQNLFQCHVRQDSSAIQRWQLDTGGIYVSTGIGGPITGRGADLAIIDDPLKGRAEADSETVREGIYKWYTSNLRTRLMSGGRILLIMTRWHEEDLAGRLLENGDDWTVVILPAIQNDKALWPSRYGIDFLERAKRDMPPREWSALYQQTPTPEEGDYFKREIFNRFRLGEQPEYLHTYITSDFAVTNRPDADYTVFGEWGYDPEGNWWLLDVYRAQVNSENWMSQLIRWMKTKKPMAFFGEGGVIKNTIEPHLKRTMREKRAYCSVQWITRTRDKVASAAAFRSMAELGQINIPQTEWGEELMRELLTFPAGKHDDQVDMCSLLGLAVDRGISAIRPVGPEEPKDKDAWGLLDEEEPADSWKLA